MLKDAECVGQKDAPGKQADPELKQDTVILETVKKTR